MPPNNRYTFEICVDSPDAVAPAAAVADRIELCLGLDIGGLTPDIGMMELAASLGVETHVLIRVRSGDFTMTRDELSVACASIRATRQLGLKGVVIGAERAGALDLEALEMMLAAAAGLDVTLHRVIDVVEDPVAALHHAIDLGIRRVLTSGGARSAPDGMSGLAELHDAADGRIEIMAGSGINSANLPDLLSATPITSFHASCTKTIALAGRHAGLGFGRKMRLFDQGEARRIADLLRGSTPDHR